MYEAMFIMDLNKFLAFPWGGFQLLHVCCSKVINSDIANREELLASWYSQATRARGQERDGLLHHYVSLIKVVPLLLSL